jgi:hypothetical protein
MCAEGGLCAILSFERFKIFPTHNCASVCVIHESACVVYASSMREYAWYKRRPSVLMSELVRNRALPRPSTDAPRSYHAWTARSFHRHPLTITYKLACTWNVREACLFGRAPSVIHASGVRRTFVECCTVFARMRRRARYVSDSSVIVSDTCAVHVWFVSDFYPPTHREIGQFLDA